MKKLIVAALAAAGLSGLAGCVAVPVPGPYYGGGDAYYYPAPAVGVGVYAAPGYYGHYHRRYRRW
jgi:hypothetical protein